MLGDDDQSTVRLTMRVWSPRKILVAASHSSRLRGPRPPRPLIASQTSGKDHASLISLEGGILLVKLKLSFVQIICLRTDPQKSLNFMLRKIYLTKHFLLQSGKPTIE